MGNYYHYEHLLKCIDPLHVGCGSYLVERVDLPVFRETGTRLPVIPGASISGVLRTLVADDIGCSGRGGQDGMNHCGKCDACTIFGYADKGKTFRKGCASFYDAHIMFFPVYDNNIGTVLITTQNLIRKRIPGNNTKTTTLLINWNNVEGIVIENANELKTGCSIFALTERDFSLLVNAGLEIRTSVSINPQKGVAEDKQLFTYETVPRGTYFLFEYAITVLGKGESNLDLNNKILTALKDLSSFGIGGMRTRGLGRMEFIREVKNRDMAGT